jgi:predicted ATPase/DNA-binding SARP family transcriptional activator
MLYIHLFGHLRVFEDEQPLTFSALPKTLPLWAYLLLHRDKPVPRDKLAYLLWPDVPERKARANLRRHLYDLRQALPPAPGDRPWLLLEAGAVQWNPEAKIWLDLAEFERLSTSTDHLAKAVELYGGDLLPDCYDDWISFERERLRNQYFDNLAALIEENRACGDFPQAITYLQELLNHDPLREDALRDLLVLRYRIGDRAGAIKSYLNFEQCLQEELDALPMPETRQLYNAIVQNIPLPASRMSRIEPVRPAAPHSLPAPLNAFVGRAKELSAIQNLLSTSGSRVRLLTLTGPAGAGKTRLALEAGNRFLKSQPGFFPDGIFFVDLSSIGESSLVIPAVAETLRLEERSDQPLLDVLKGFFRDRYLLLILDNFEHVIPAAPVIADVLTVAPNLRVLVTSRAVLRVYGEHEYAVPPLPLPDLDRPASENLRDNAAVSLFLTRARERKPDFDLTEMSATTVAEICVRLDGLPLAIELAASRIKMFTPAAILSRLTNRLAFLTDGPRDLPRRHRTLRGAIEWSYDLLDEDEKCLFASLGVFPGGCTLEAAEAVCGSFCGGEVATALSSLLDESLIHRTEQNGETRFGMVGAIREYALEQLSRSRQLNTLRQNHAEYYVALAEQAHLVRKSPQYAVFLKVLRAEYDNLREALLWLLNEAADDTRVQLGAKLTQALWAFWEMSGRFSEARAWNAQALLHADRLALDMRTYLLYQAGWFSQLQGEYPSADAFYQEGLGLARRAGDEKLIVMGLHSLGAMAGRQGDYERAETILSEAIAIERASSEGRMTPSLASLLNNQAIVAKRLGKFERAAALLQESVSYKRARGDDLGLAVSLVNLGNLALALQDHLGARSFFLESLQLRQSLGDKTGILPLLGGLAELAIAQGDMQCCVSLLGAYQSLAEELGYSILAETQREHERYLDLLREQLPQTEFYAGWMKGYSMTLEETIAFALEFVSFDS